MSSTETDVTRKADGHRRILPAQLGLQKSEVLRLLRLRQARQRDRGAPVTSTDEMLKELGVDLDVLYGRETLGKLLRFTFEEYKFLGTHGEPF
jgi:hypothetical protein